MECEFYDIENLDGYFSGTMYLMMEDKRYILDFGYDIEFRRLKQKTTKSSKNRDVSSNRFQLLHAVGLESFPLIK